MLCPMPSPGKNLSLRDLAKKVGLSPATVSFALRGHPKIPEATRRRVEEAARKYGYRANAAMSAAMSAAGSGGKRAYRETVACLSPGTALDHATGDANEAQRRAFLTGIRQRAEEIGCDLDFLPLEESVKNSSLSRILRARGIDRVLIVLGVSKPPENVALEELADAFTTVFIGYPEIHRCPGAVVRPDYFAAGQQAFYRGWSAGYRKFVLMPLPILLNPDKRFLAGFSFAAQLFQGKSSARITILPLHGRFHVDSLKRQASPQTCFVGGVPLHQYPRLLEVIHEPHNPGYIDWHANLYREHHNIAGIDQRDAAQAAEALEICLRSLDNRSRRTLRGVHLIEPRWVEGETLRQQRPDSLNLAQDDAFPHSAAEKHHPVSLPASMVSHPEISAPWKPQYPPPPVPEGTWRFHGIPFKLEPPTMKPAPVFLDAQANDRSAEIRLGFAADALYFFHGCADQHEPGQIGTYLLTFSDGSEASHPLIHHKLYPGQPSPGRKGNIMDWWPTHHHINAGNIRCVCLMDFQHNPGQRGYYYILRWKLPKTKQPLERLRVEIEPRPQGKLLLFALTAATA